MSRSYSERMGSDAVSLVHEQMETFKYVGGFVQDTRDPALFIESGEGLPVSILALPDFVLDFHQDNLKSPSPVSSVGGHAGHIASTLLHLLSDEDATHRVHFLTRTGRLATMLLDDEFQRDRPENSHDTYKRYCEPFVFIRDGQPRWAHWSGRDIDPSPAEAGGEMTAQDHIALQPFVMNALRTTQAVYIGSFKTPDCANILDAVLRTIGCSLLFLDTRRADEDSRYRLEELLQVLERRVQAPQYSALKPEIILFVGGEECDVVWRAAASALHDVSITPDGLARRLEMRLLCYTPASVDLYTGFDGEMSGPLLDNLPGRIVETYPASRFRAGVILAASTHRTLQLLSRTIERQTKKCTCNWGQALYDWFEGRWRTIGGFWTGVAAYGAALASVRTGDGHFSFNDVLGHFAPDDHCTLSSSEAVARVVVRTEPVHGTSRICLDSTAVGDFAELAARRRCRTLTNPLTAQCKPLRCGDGCVITERKTAVMIDLDGTLMDSTSQRGRALDKALATLHATEGLLHPDFRERYDSSARRLQFFEDRVYALHAFFKWLGLGDFRQQWNPAGWYAAYVVQAQSPSLRDGLDQVVHQWHAINNDKALSQEQRRERRETLKGEGIIGDFRREYECVLRNRVVEIGEAKRAFSGVQLHPLKEAHDLLTSLQASDAFHLYIVSEGDPDTQWNKLCSIGLSRFFGRAHVLTTGDVAPEYDNERRQFAGEQGELRRRREETERELRYLHRAAADLTEMESDISTWPAPNVSAAMLDKLAMSVRNKHRKKQLVRERGLMRRKKRLGREIEVAMCVEKILARLRDKLSLAFYAAVIRAIMRNPERPLDTLRNLQKIRCEELGTPRMKLAMIGDRQTKDLRPPLELLLDSQTGDRKGLVTIRLLCGRYAASKDENPDNADHPYEPDFLALTLAHVKAILLSPNTWKALPCLEQEPPLFNWAVNLEERTRVPENPEDNTESIGVDHILGGMSMSNADFPVISNLCAAFLSEYVGRCSENERNNILALLWEKVEGAVPQERRAARLSAFVLAGALANHRITEQEEWQFARELAECRKRVATAWIKERVLNALHWIKDHARGENARQTADGATK